jgi:hypothetical protein
LPYFNQASSYHHLSSIQANHLTQPLIAMTQTEIKDTTLIDLAQTNIEDTTLVDMTASKCRTAGCDNWAVSGKNHCSSRKSYLDS